MARHGSGSAIVGSLVFLVIVAVLCLEAQATDFNVGGNDGTWTVPETNNGLNYIQWASSNKFVKGDRLIFKYDGSRHSVLRVTPQAYQTCNSTSPIEAYEKGDNDLNVELQDAEPFYFICGVPFHCPADQKFSVNVQGAAVALKYSLSMIVAAITLGSFLLFL